jgi:predicted kinase
MGSEPGEFRSRSHVVLMCGIAGAGKTTYAKRLEADGYVRRSIDEEVWERFGRYGIDYEPSMYAQHSAAAEAVLRERLVELIDAGADVVVDNAFWQRERREQYKAVAESAGARWELIYLKTSPELLRERLTARRSRFDANAAFPITDELLDHFLKVFEEPSGEGEIVVYVSDTPAGGPNQVVSASVRPASDPGSWTQAT